MELYTNLVALKQAVGGELPPMTPLGPEALSVIDPRYVLGLGALLEKPRKGLKCPIRHCRRWVHQLGQHLNVEHADIGGAPRIRELLEVPLAAPLASRKFRMMRRAMAARPAARTHIARVRPPLKHDPESIRKRGEIVSKTKSSMMVRNAMNRCEAQLAAKILGIQSRNGGTPVTKRQAVEAFGDTTIQYAIRVYGTWNAFKEAIGARLAPGRAPRLAHHTRQVFESVAAFYDVHGRAPVSEDFELNRCPVLASEEEVLASVRAVTLAAATDAILWSTGRIQPERRAG